MLGFHFLSLKCIPFLFPTVVPDDDGLRGRDEDDRPSRSQTPPTPPVHAGSSQSHPPSARPMRQRAMAQLEIVRDMTGSDPVGRIRSTS